MTPQTRLSFLGQEAWPPGGPGPELLVPLGTSTPQSSGPGRPTPHHYISSMRVASMRGAADMGGALVARVATFLRTQYKNLTSSPLVLSWCPAFRMDVSDFDTSLVQVPLLPHLKVPPGLLSLPAILQAHQRTILLRVDPRGASVRSRPTAAQHNSEISFNESTVEDRPKRVLVEGDPGYGKSTLALKLAYDWAADPTGSYLSSYRCLHESVKVQGEGSLVLTYKNVEWQEREADSTLPACPLVQGRAAPASQHSTAGAALNTLVNHHSLVFVVTLRDFRGGSLYSHLCKEVLPRHILSKEAMNTLWNHLKKIEEKVLFLLVGYDELSEEESGDITELLEGQMLPNATVVLTSRPGSAKPMPALLHRRLLIAGLAPDQTHRFITKYFRAINKPGSTHEVMSLVTASREKYGDLVTCPIMCLALGVLYEDLGGKLPSRLTDMYMALVKHMIRKNLLRRGEPMCYDVLPDKYNKLLSDFGKLALEALKCNTPYFTGQDLKTRCQHGGEVVELGILLKMHSMSKLSKKDHYTPIHKSFLEFLAAFYLSGLIHDPSLLQVEIDSIAEKLDITQPILR
ncbi:Protein NLRC3 [Chionoecetes opilio]|uniref:Protein NLRC3 n=1 Tax=Chionoecetes opilio TaxID=41210 RepID=A0A8J5CVE3_CHIOP|nr:Protein NLRC3 [Chionoecetes opilio]